jgi:hypothetical protein
MKLDQILINRAAAEFVVKSTGKINLKLFIETMESEGNITIDRKKKYGKNTPVGVVVCNYKQHLRDVIQGKGFKGWNDSWL